jgi:hypothetical protein
VGDRVTRRRRRGRLLPWTSPETRRTQRDDRRPRARTRREPDGAWPPDDWDGDDDWDGAYSTGDGDEHGSRGNEVPVSVAFDAVIASTPDLAVFVSGLRVYSNGVDFTVEMRARQPSSQGEEGIGRGLHSWSGDRMLLGVEFSDGHRTSTLPYWGRSGEPGGPSLCPGGGSSGGRTADLSMFLSPIPPPGDLRLVCAWPAQGIDDTFTALPCEEIRDAASRVVQLWEWEPEVEDEVEAPGHPDVPAGSWFARDARRG